MAYDEALAERLRGIFRIFIHGNEVEEKKMFGGLCFMVSKHMCCGIVGDKLMARVGPDKYEECLSRNHVKEMNFTGRPMKGMVYIDHVGITADEDLKYWVKMCLQFIKSLPPKI